MKKQIVCFILALCMILTLLPTTVFASSSTKTIKCGDFYELEITDVYAMDSVRGVSGDGVTYIYFVVVPNGAKVNLKKLSREHASYMIAPFNDITFENKSPKYPKIEEACDYDDNVFVSIAEGDVNTVSKNNEYYYMTGESGVNYGIRIFVVEDEQLVQFGGPKPAAKPKYTSKELATPSKSQFVVMGKKIWNGEEEPITVTQAYNINQTNYLQLRAIATLLKDTVSQFNIGWDGQYAVIEPGKAYGGTVTGSKMQNTNNIRKSETKFKMNGEVFKFNDARLINGDTNYIQLREFAQKLSGTASQFNVYWDEYKKQVVIQPGLPYTGQKSINGITKTVLEKYSGDEEYLPEGNYYMTLLGKFVHPVKGGDYWIELRSDMPEKPYNIKFIGVDKDKGAKYSISYNGTYIMLPGSVEGKQLVSTTSPNPHYWRIDNHNSFITIRDYKQQKLLVNSKGNSNAEKTIVVGVKYDISKLDKGKITLYKEDKDNSKTISIYSMPTKTNYKVGEAFDTTGINVVLNEGGVDKNINDQIEFYTSGTVELTHGRKFTTAGKKTIDIRYNGITYAQFTIVVE